MRPSSIAKMYTGIPLDTTADIPFNNRDTPTPQPLISQTEGLCITKNVDKLQPLLAPDLFPSFPQLYSFFCSTRPPSLPSPLLLFSGGLVGTENVDKNHDDFPDVMYHIAGKQGDIHSLAAIFLGHKWCKKQKKTKRKTDLIPFFLSTNSPPLHTPG